MPSRRHSSAMLDSPRRPSRTMRIFSSAADGLHKSLRRRTTRHGFLSHFCSSYRYDEPEILPSSNRQICLTGPDPGQVILRHERRRLISLTVTDHPTAEWIARQITDAFPWDEAPDYMVRDRDKCYGHAVTKRLAAMGMRDHPIAPRSPWQNRHAERL